jgi:hypothetical protein
MILRKLLRIALPLVLLGAGIWLLRQPGTLQPDGTARQTALLQALAPGASVGISNSDPEPANQPVTYEPVEPGVVDISQIVAGADFTDTMEYRWLNGEIDLDRESTILAETEMNRLRQLALNMEPQPEVDLARIGPAPAAPIRGASFDSLSFNEETGGAVPPDPELAVGPNHLVAAVNIAFAIYDKSGNTLTSPILATDVFSQEPCNQGLFDPNVLYDEEADRWLIGYDVGDFDSDGGYCLLVSQSSDPTTVWYDYFFPLNDSSVWLDFPQAGVGDNYIFMGGNMFTHPGGVFTEGRIFAFEKNDLYNGSPVAVRELGLGGGHSTPQPLNSHGYSTGTWPNFGNDHYFLTDPFNGQTYRLVRWNPVSGSSTVVGVIDLGNGAMPVPVPQNGPEDAKLEANDFRPLDFEYRNGYGWTTMTVACNPGSGTVDCVRWAQIRLADATLGPAGTGLYGSISEYRFFPDLAVNHCNDMLVGYTKSSPAMYPAIWVSGREAGDRVGALQPEIEMKAGEVTYQSIAGDVTPYRWGDYTGMAIDPDGRTFWYMGQYSREHAPTAKWGTYISAFTFPGCAPTTTPLDHDHYLPLIITAGPPPADNVLVNGNFEAGPASGWSASSTQGYALIVREANMPSYVDAHDGSWLAWLGGANDEISRLSQSVTVPASEPTLHYWYWIDSADNCGYDFGGVIVNDNFAVDILNLCQDQNTGGWQQRTVNLASFAGQQIKLSFRAELDETLSSNFFVDDVTLGMAEASSTPPAVEAATGEASGKAESGVPTSTAGEQSHDGRIWPVTGNSK